MIIKSERYENIDINPVVDIIISAIDERRPIWIRHHNDADGYSAALVLEKALLSRLYRAYTRESDLLYYYKRSACKAPFYDITDATKDAAFALADSSRFGRKPPLIIIADNGASAEDLIALKKIRLFGVKIVVIDHHPLNDENRNYVDVMLHTPTDLTAGMICAEVAHMLEPGPEQPVLAAVAGIADKSSSTELEAYIRLAEEQGFSRERLYEIGEMIETESFSLGFLEGREYMKAVLFNPDVQDGLIKIAKEIMEEKNAEVSRAVEKGLEIITEDDVVIGMFDISIGLRENSYRIAARHVMQKLESLNKRCIALVYGADMVTIRVGDIDADVNVLKDVLKKEIPWANVKGGGHAKAGSLIFAPIAREDVLRIIKRCVR